MNTWYIKQTLSFKVMIVLYSVMERGEKPEVTGVETDFESKLLKKEPFFSTSRKLSISFSFRFSNLRKD